MKTRHSTHCWNLHLALRQATLSRLLVAAIVLSHCGITRGQPAFNYAPITNSILGASLSINFAAMTANPFVGSTAVNQLRLWDASGGTSMDLSQALFGLAPWPAPPQVNQGPLQTGFVSASINPTFFTTLQSGQVGMTALFTDTGDGWFAIDTIQLNITTSAGTISPFYGSPADGFGIGIAPGGNLPGPLPGSLPFTGTGFDEAISGKSIYLIPEPGITVLAAMGLLLLALRRRKPAGLGSPIQNQTSKIKNQKVLPVAMVLLISGLLSSSTSTAQPLPLTRADAAAALLSPSSGVIIDTSKANVWSPFVNFGSGTNYEGLLPPGSYIDPFDDYGSGTITLLSSNYFFFIDDLLGANYAHPTRFVLVDATNQFPVLGNGIRVIDEAWWPIVTPLFGSPTEYFNNDATSAFPPGPSNPDGLIAGSPPPPAPAIPIPSPPEPLPPPPAGTTTTNACALIINGSAEAHRACTVSNYLYDVTNHYGVPRNRVVLANGGNAASSNDVRNAITTICNSQPPCDKIFVRIISHGNTNAAGYYILLAGRRVYANDLCNMFKLLANKGVPICMVMDTCFSGASLQPNNWNFPAGSVIITSADGNHSSFGQSSYLDGTNKFCGDLYPYAFSQCLNANPTNRINGQPLDRNGDGFVDDAEAHRWVTNVHLVTFLMFHPSPGATRAAEAAPIILQGPKSAPSAPTRA